MIRSGEVGEMLAAGRSDAEILTVALQRAWAARGAKVTVDGDRATLSWP